ncbi:hypothetical protein SAMN05421640_2493 [Ekhidna lutea]|uniref:Lipoprotein n=1 Tax=Ekhidna lutea TaxID=447679 RepID=A0A239K9F2_EKHLU|nr:hypothetical protein [Ekhidna lutea]SNT14378.1 hypothetical protein SAMN05421640_2493 [Ekhidna lutea]
MKSILKLFAFSVIALSCTGRYDVNDLHVWINDEENGLIKERIIDDLKLTVKYLPPEVLAIKELDVEFEKAAFDSLVQVYSNQESFLISFESRLENKDVVYKNVSDKEDYNRRIEQLSFRIGELISLKTSNDKISPSLFHYERAYGTSKVNSVFLVFTDKSKKLLSAEKLDIVFVDEIFKTGISHFVFKRSDIQKIPSLNVR